MSVFHVQPHRQKRGKRKRKVARPRQAPAPMRAQTVPQAPRVSPGIEALLRRTSRGVGEINARTSARMDALRPLEASAKAIYADATAAQTGQGAALKSDLSGAGQALSADYGGRFAQIQAPTQTTQQYAGAQATTGAGSGAAVGALSSADRERLYSEGTAEAIYAAALPRLAELAGAQERRGMLLQAQDDLAQLALEEAEQRRQEALDERDFQYRARQDQLDRQRQRRLDLADRNQTAYERRQDKLEAARQAKLDRLAEAAAAQEYGLKLADDARSDATAQETARHHRVTEANARATQDRLRRKDARDAANDAKGGGDKTKYFDQTRDDVFRRAATYAKSKNKALKRNRIDRGTARSRLWAEFGTLLTDRGYKQSLVHQMIERALNAAGY